MCALCVGLAGSTKLLGRAEKVSDYVKRGEQSGSTKITLSSGPDAEPVTIFRRIKPDNSSEWKINGSPASMEKVTKLTKEYSVQIDNLCAFLPQDRVVEFAQLKPVELLQETEKAIGDTELHDRHMELVKLRGGLRGLETKVEKHESFLAEKREQNKDVERDVTKFKEREQLRANADKMAQKLPWIQYEDAKAKYTETKEKRNEGKQRVKEKQELLAKASEPFKAVEDEIKVAKATKTKSETEFNSASKKVKDLTGQIGGYGAEYDKHLEAIEELRTMGEEEEERKQALRNRIAHLKQKLEECPTDVPPELAQKLEDVREMIKQGHAKRKNLMSVEQDLIERTEGAKKPLDHCENRIREMKSVRSVRLQALGQRNPELLTIARWVQDNRGKFRGPVYGPIACDIDVPNELHARMLEQHVPGFLWTAFVTTSEEDRDFFLKNCKGVAVINYTDNPDGPIAYTKGEATTHAHLGVMNTLDKVFEAPMVIKHVLCDHARLNQAYTVKADGNVERIFRETNLDMLWSPENQHAKTTSRYNRGAVTTRVVALRPGRIFGGGAAPGASKEELAQLQKEMAEHKKALEKLEEERSKVQKEMRAHHEKTEQPLNDERKRLEKEVKEYVGKRPKIVAKLEAAEQDLEEAEKHASVESRIEKSRRIIEDLVQERVKWTAVLVAALETKRAAIHEMAQCEFGIAELERRKAELQEELREQQEALESAEKTLEALEVLVNEDKAALRARLDAATAAAPYSAELKEYFETLSSDYDELEAQVSAMREKADRMLCPNPNILEEYNQRLREIAELEKSLDGDRAELQAGLAKVAAERDLWLPQVRNLVSRINVGFGKSFEAIGCAGEVRLIERGDEYETYSIEIRVKFREEEDLQVLCATRQSGGERSVSTILYLLALTSLTNGLGFRVCDEINQGMDPNNERKVFQQLVASMTKPGTPQSFLLTPKLLPDLEYSEDVTVLHIFNGPFVKNVADSWTQEAFWRKRLHEDGAAAGPAPAVAAGV